MIEFRATRHVRAVAMISTGLIEPARLPQGEAQVAQSHRLAVAVVGFAEDRDGLLVHRDRLGGSARPQQRGAEIGQGRASPEVIAGLAKDGDGTHVRDEGLIELLSLL